MTKKEQIEEIYIDALNNDEAPNVFADRILFLFGVSGSYSNEAIKAIKFDAHNGLPDDCVKGYDEVKFCEVRQGKGGECKWCSNYH